MPDSRGEEMGDDVLIEDTIYGPMEAPSWHAETVIRPLGDLPASSVEESERIAAWLELPGIRLIETTGDWAWPINAGLPDGALAAELLGQPALLAS